MITLAIETATAACSVALIDGDDILASAHEVVGRGHAERLVPMIRECLAGHDRPQAVLVDCGPGSFTGVRVGLAAARAFGLAWGVPVHGFSSLALLATMVGDEALAAAIGGGHGEIFVQRFRDRRPVDALRSLTPADAAAAVSEALVVGPGAALLVEARGSGEARALLPDALACQSLPAELAALAPSPIYGRAPDAKLPGARSPGIAA